MKKILYTLLAGAMVLTSCSKEAAEELATQAETTTFTLSVDQIETRAQSTITPERYIMEVWSEDGTTAENVFENGTKNHAELMTSSGNSFTVVLDKTKAYTCLFWADDNTTFDAASLKSVKLNSGKDMTEAYYAKIAVAKGKNPTVAVTLERAVTKITLVETATVKTTEDLALKFSNTYTQFDALAGSATGTAVEWTRTIKPVATTGTIGSFYFFAKPTKELVEFKFTYASETGKTVSNIPFRMNFFTTIKGGYSDYAPFKFSVTINDNWSGTENKVEFTNAAVGDFFMKDGTWLSKNTILTAEQKANCIGIVFLVFDNPKHGKVLGLEEKTDVPWSTEKVKTGADKENDSPQNMKIIAGFIEKNGKTWDDYPVFKWVAEQNGKPNGGWDENQDKWYLPGKMDLTYLNGTYDSGRKYVKTDVGHSLKALGLSDIISPVIWSSTEVSADQSGYAKCDDTNGTIGDKDKTQLGTVRCIRTF